MKNKLVIFCCILFASCAMNRYKLTIKDANVNLLKKGTWIEVCTIDTSFNKILKSYRIISEDIMPIATCLNGYKKGQKHGKSKEFYSNGYWAMGKYFDGLRNQIWYFYNEDNEVVMIIAYNACIEKKVSYLISSKVYKNGKLIQNAIYSPIY